MRLLSKIVILGAALTVAGCTTTAPVGQERLEFRAPAAAPVASISSSASPQELAQKLRATGYRDVAVLKGGVVRLRAKDAGFVDCGMLIQLARGNRAEFAGTSAKAALIANRPEGDLLLRTLHSQSEILLHPQSGGYRVDESHQITLGYHSVKTGQKSVSRAQIKGEATAKLSDGSTCRSSGRIGKILG